MWSSQNFCHHPGAGTREMIHDEKDALSNIVVSRVALYSRFLFKESFW